MIICSYGTQYECGVHHRSDNCVLSTAVSMFAKLSKLFDYSLALEKSVRKYAVSYGKIDGKSAKN